MAAKKEIAEIGFYAFGFGLFFPGYLELFVKGLSLRVFKDGVARFEIRGDIDRYAALFFNGNRQIGTQGDDLQLGFFGTQDDGPLETSVRLMRSGGFCVPDLTHLPTILPNPGEVLLFVHQGKLRTMNSAGEISEVY